MPDEAQNPVTENEENTSEQKSDEESKSDQGQIKKPLKPKRKIDLSKKDSLFELFFEDSKHTNDEIKKLIQEHIKALIEQSPIGQNYEVLFMYDLNDSIGDYDVDKIYRSLPKMGEKKNILLILYSHGGSGEAAYLISKCCKEYSDKFSVSIPRKAKSAATLLALGADEIHMGQMSHLGPIDPQIGGLPALGLGNAVEYLSRLCEKYPESYEMIAKYLSYKLDLPMLGYFERVSESSVQYAQRLLEDKKLPKGKTPKKVAEDLVYSYKDHGFIIEKDEAKKHLGEMIKIDTPEYQLGDALHEFLEDVNFLFRYARKKDFSVIGNPETGIRLFDKGDE